MVVLTIAMLVSHDTTTKGGGVVFNDLLFLFMPSPSRYGCKREGHPCIEKGINMTFNNLIQIIVEICEIVLSNRATPGSSLVTYKTQF